MKKALSLVLSVLMVIMSITCLMTMPASAAETVWDFEDGIKLNTNAYFDSALGTPATYPDDGVWSAMLWDGIMIKDNSDGIYKAGSFAGPVYGTDGTLVKTQKTDTRNRSVGDISTNFSLATDPADVNNNVVSIANQGNNWNQTFIIKVEAGKAYDLTFDFKGTVAGDKCYTALMTSLNAWGHGGSGGETDPNWGHWNSFMPIPNTIGNPNKAEGSTVYDDARKCLYDASNLSLTTSWQTEKYTFVVPAENVTEVFLVFNNRAASAALIDNVTLKEHLPYVEDGTFEGREVGDSLMVSDVRTWPEAYEFGSSANEGYFRGIDYANKYYYDNVSEPRFVTDDDLLNSKTSKRIHDIDGWKYIDNNGAAKVDGFPNTATTAKIVAGGHNSDKAVEVYPNYRTAWTKVNLPRQNTDYKVKLWIKNSTVDLTATNGHGLDIAVTTTANIDNVNNSISTDNNFTWCLDRFEIPATGTFSTTEWTPVEFEFNSGVLTEAYIAFSGNVYGGKYLVDDITVEEAASLKQIVFVDKNKTVIANCNAAATVNYEGTVGTVSGLSSDAKFLGWFADVNDLSAPLSTEASYDCKNGEAPVVMVNNILTDSSSFENIEKGTNLKYAVTDGSLPTGNKWGGNANDGYMGQVPAGNYPAADGTYYTVSTASGALRGGNGVNATVTDEKAFSGKQSLKVLNGFWAASLPLNVQPNKTYQLSYKILAAKDDKANLQNTVARSGVVSSLYVNNQGVESPLTNIPDKIAFDKKEISTLHDGENWQTVIHTFTTKDIHNVAYLVLGQTAYGDTGNKASWAYIDDLTLREVSLAKVDSIDMKSNAAIQPIECDFNNLVTENMASFKVIYDGDTAPVVKANDIILNSVDGVYAFEVKDTNTLSVRFAGDEDLNDYNKDYEGRPLDEYNKDVYLEPVWEGNTVYQESALFTTVKDTVKLLYPVDKVVSLRSYSLDINYVEGVDYEITSDGQIKRLENSRIPVFNAEGFKATSGSSWDFADGSGQIAYTSDAGYSNYAVSVTYEHSKTFADGYQPSTPASQADAISKTLAKLEAGEHVNIAILGDSISCGWSSSGLNSYAYYNNGTIEKPYLINAAPYAPTWMEMLAAELNAKYPGQVTLKTIALGGKTAQWGAENVVERLENMFKEGGTVLAPGTGAVLTPDLMLFGFGVNDSNAGVSVADFKTYMQAIITNARAKYADLEFIMYSPMLPNQLGVDWPAERLLAYEEAMNEIAASNANVGVLELTSIFAEIVKCKAPEDYLSSYLNHGNDFTARMYATGLLAAMTPVEKETVSTAYNNLAAISTGANSSTGKNGLRVYNSISKEFIADKNIVEYGSIAIRKARLNGAELNINTANAAIGKAFDGTNANLWDETEDSEIFTAYLVGIADRFYGDEYSIRAYAKDSEGNYYYGKTVEVCLYDIVYSIDKGNAASGTVTEDDKAAFYAFAKSGDDFAAYDAWLQKNELEAGSLRNA